VIPKKGSGKMDHDYPLGEGGPPGSTQKETASTKNSSTTPSSLHANVSGGGGGDLKLILKK